METQNSETKLTLHRLFTRNSSFESFGLTLESLQTPVSPTLEMQVHANVYPQDNDMHQAVLGLSIQAKHQAEVIWRVQLEQAGFYTVEGFSEAQQKAILNGFCMNQLYVYAGPVVNQMVVQAGFAPIYLQPMDFHQLYQQQLQKESSSTEQGASSPAQAVTASADLSSALKRIDERLSGTPQTIN